MKKIYSLAIALLICASTFTFSQTFIAGQNFDAELSWGYTEFPAAYIVSDGKDIWSVTPSLNTGEIGP